MSCPVCNNASSKRAELATTRWRQGSLENLWSWRVAHTGSSPTQSRG